MNAAACEAIAPPRYDASELTERLAALIAPPPDRHAGDWAEACRVMPEGTPFPGPWRNDRAPYLVPIFEAAAQFGISTVVVAMGSQMGKTELQMNILGHRFDDGPRVPALYIGPTRNQVRSMSKNRFAKMFRSSPTLWSKLAGGHDDNTFEKIIGGIELAFAWAGSPTELASRPCGLVVVDEIDRMDDDVGGEGDPATLADARTKNYPNSKIVIVSTPTTEGSSAIWTLLEEGTCELWAWPCQHCGQFFVPHLALLRWQPDATPEQAHDSAAVCCPDCGGLHHTGMRRAMNAGGRYIRHCRAPDGYNGHQVLGHYVPDPAPVLKRSRSFWVSGLATPSPEMTFGVLAERILKALRSRNQKRVQARVNTDFGEPYALKGEAPPWELVAGLKRDYAPWTVPDGVQVVMMGADVQADGIWYMLWGFGYNLGAWCLAHEFLTGDPEYDDVWLKLSTVIHRPVGDHHIRWVAVDSGFRPGDNYRRPEHMVYKFARRHPERVWPSKGYASLDKPYYIKDIDREVDGRTVPVPLLNVNTDHMKSIIYARYHWPEDDAGAWRFHNAFDEDACKQMVAEQLVKTRTGGRKWDAGKRPNHLFDCAVLALTLALRLNAQTSLPTWEQHLARVKTVQDQQRKPRAPGFIQRPAGRFVGS